MSGNTPLNTCLDLFDLSDTPERPERCQCARCREARGRPAPPRRPERPAKVARVALARPSIETQIARRASGERAPVPQALEKGTTAPGEPDHPVKRAAKVDRPVRKGEHQRRPRSSRGMALVSVLVAMLLLSAVGAGLVIVTSADTLIGANVGAASETFYAANAAFERTVGELRTAPDLSALLSGATASAFTDGTAGGVRQLADGTRVNLTQALALANCNRLAGCSGADMNAVGRDRPWGPRNPRWRLFSYGPLVGAALGGTRTSWPTYVLTFLADDPLETDGDTLRDGVQAGVNANPGAGIVLVRAEAYGRRRSRRIVEGSILRRDVSERAIWESLPVATRGSPPPTTPVLHLIAWREVR